MSKLHLTIFTEMQSKSFLQSKLNAEKAERLRLEMELSILRAKFDKNK
jgi:hypothetical protein